MKACMLTDVQIAGLAGDAILILAGETHSAINGGETECTYIAVTVPPLDKTH
jgi:mannose-6-phosphate isomerase-like protein (cupin superfamily)